MLAGVVHGSNDIRYEEIDMPVVKDDEVLIKVKFTGICGSDVPRVNADACHFYPNVLGHEFSGEIAEVGAKVTKFKPGDRVAGVPLVPCMECEDCIKGNYSQCKHYSFIGSRRFGSFAEYVAVPEQNAFPIGEDVSFEQGALFEPSSIALHALRCADFRGGRSVAVIGCGMIGLFAIQWARILGAKQIVAVNRSREKLPLAQRLGATDIVSTMDDDYYDQLMCLTNGRGFDYVFDATGNAAMMTESFHIAANKASVCMIGTPKDTISFSVKEWEYMNRKEFKLTGSWMSYSAPFPGEEWELTAHCFGNGQLIYNRDMIFRIMGLSEIADAFELYKTPGAVKGKILINSEQ